MNPKLKKESCFLLDKIDESGNYVDVMVFKSQCWLPPPTSKTRPQNSYRIGQILAGKSFFSRKLATILIHQSQDND